MPKKVLVGKIWDMHEPRCVRMKRWLVLLACPFFTLYQQKEGSEETVEILEHQRKVLEIKDHLDEACRSAAGEDQWSVT